MPEQPDGTTGRHGEAFRTERTPLAPCHNPLHSHTGKSAMADVPNIVTYLPKCFLPYWFHRFTGADIDTG